MSNLMDVGRAGLIAVVIAGSVVVVGSRVGGDDGDLVRARFQSAAPLVEGNQVKIDGVVVGTVEELEVRDGLAEVSLDLDEVALPLHEDARLTIRPVSLLGERYIDLDRGSPEARVIEAGEVIPVGRTATSVGLDEVLNTVDHPTGSSLRALVSTLGEGLQGNGENVDATLKALSPSLQETRALAAVLDEHNELLTRLITDFEPVADALATRDGKAMDQLVDSSDRVLAAVRDRQTRLEETLQRLPGTLKVLRSTLGNLRSAADDTAPTLAELRPLTDQLPAIAGELRAFSDVLDPALATSEPVLRKADELLRAAAPLAADARRAGAGLARTTDGLRRVTGDVTNNRENLFDYIRFWALSTNGRDGLSHYFRVNATVNPDMLAGLLPTTAGPSTSGAEPGTDRPPTAQGSAPAPPAGGLLDGVGKVLEGLLQPKPKSGSATGLNEQQELDLLGMLLGGR